MGLLGDISRRVEGRTPDDIAVAISRMIRRRELMPGDQLPTVRAIASELGVSSSTVAEAWRILARHGLIDTGGRRGTRVRSARADATGRFWQVPAGGDSILDLSTGTPDSQLLPDLGPVLHRVQTNVEIASYIDRPVLLELEAVLRERWPFEPEAITVVDGALDGLDRLLSALVGFGDVVVVEDPTFPPILDMLDLLGAEVIGIPLDDAGPELGPLQAALDRHPVAIVLQPTAHNPTGITTSSERLRAIADAMRAGDSQAIIIEDNHSGDVAGAELHSIGAWLPAQTVHICSFSKSHGPDLRIAALGGAAETIDAVVDRRRLGPSWTSRLVQHVLLAMLTDDSIANEIADAATEYARRRRVLLDALADSGVDVVGGDSGLNLWVPVHDEARAVLALALKGIGVASGPPFCIRSSGDHIRVTIGTARDDLEELAAAIAAAATGDGGARRHDR